MIMFITYENNTSNMLQIRKYAHVMVILLLVALLAGCITSDNGTDNTGEDYSDIDVDLIDEEIESLPTSELSEDEIAGILYMREEEKLARDVYLTLYDLWSRPIFANIAASEETHTTAVKTLILRYGLEDPFIDEIGSFTNETLQALYTDLVEAGSGSIVDALMVGAMIEEIDMVDIASYIEKADNADIILVYDNLMMGSRNHLRSFVSNLENEGVEYEPSYLSQEEYDDIIGSDMESNRYMGRKN